MIHTDIKLENILLPPGFDPKTDFDKVPINVKLIDLGSIASAGRWHKHLATTRFYRAPEIILGLKWSFECDIWSLGCLLVELVLGHIPFIAQEPICHLFLIQHMISAFPRWMLDQTANDEIRSAIKGGLIDPSIFKGKEHEDKMAQPPLIDLIRHEPLLCDLALKMLEPDPAKRIPFDGILAHPFLRNADGPG
jgi:dual-specificity kinase